MLAGYGIAAENTGVNIKLEIKVIMISRRLVAKQQVA